MNSQFLPISSRSGTTTSKAINESIWKTVMLSANRTIETWGKPSRKWFCFDMPSLCNARGGFRSSDIHLAHMYLVPHVFFSTNILACRVTSWSEDLRIFASESARSGRCPRMAKVYFSYVSSDYSNMTTLSN